MVCMEIPVDSQISATPEHTFHRPGAVTEFRHGQALRPHKLRLALGREETEPALSPAALMQFQPGQGTERQPRTAQTFLREHSNRAHAMQRREAAVPRVAAKRGTKAFLDQHMFLQMYLHAGPSLTTLLRHRTADAAAAVKIEAAVDLAEEDANHKIG